MLLILIAIQDGFIGIGSWLIENRVMVYIGKISYGLYVYHMFICLIDDQLLLKYIWFKLDIYSMNLTLFIINLGIASLSWYLIENKTLCDALSFSKNK